MNYKKLIEIGGQAILHIILFLLLLEESSDRWRPTAPARPPSVDLCNYTSHSPIALPVLVIVEIPNYTCNHIPVFISYHRITPATLSLEKPTGCFNYLLIPVQTW